MQGIIQPSLTISTNSFYFHNICIYGPMINMTLNCQLEFWFISYSGVTVCGSLGMRRPQKKNKQYYTPKCSPKSIVYWTASINCHRVVRTQKSKMVPKMAPYIVICSVNFMSKYGSFIHKVSAKYLHGYYSSYTVPQI